MSINAMRQLLQIPSNIPAVDNGAKYAELFVGQCPFFTDVYPMKTDKEFVNALEDHICYCRAMDKLISDLVQAEISKKVTNITMHITLISGN
jgi:hypothetical protein